MTVNPLVVVTNFNDGTFSYFVLFHNVNKFLVHDSFHISLSIFQINISPDPGNVEMKQQEFEAVSRGLTRTSTGSK